MNVRMMDNSDDINLGELLEITYTRILSRDLFRNWKVENYFILNLEMLNIYNASVTSFTNMFIDHQLNTRRLSLS